LTTVPDAYTKDTGDVCRVGIVSSSVGSIVDEHESDVVEGTAEDVGSSTEEGVLPGEPMATAAEAGMQASLAVATHDGTTHCMGVMHVLAVTIVVAAVKMAL
jgi:hypothetical protein